MDQLDYRLLTGFLAALKDLPSANQLEFIQNTLKTIDDPDTRSVLETLLLSQIKVSPRNIVILIHGIRTRATWQEELKSILKNDQNTRTYTIKYGWLNPISFWLPFFTRDKPLQRVLSEYRAIRQRHLHDNICLVAHSFGTYIVGNLLKKYFDLEINKLLICGSIIPESFDWNSLASRPNQIVNEVGARDYWPVGAKVWSWGYGASGTFGFGHSAVEDRYHNFGHSDFFEESFMRKFWVPYLSNGEVIDPEYKRKNPPYWLEILNFFHINYLILLAICLYFLLVHLYIA